jgi:hypothetical protein
MMRKMSSRLLTQMSRTMMSKIASAQNMPRVAEPMLRPTINLRTMRGAGASTKHGLHLSQRMKMQMTRSKMSQVALLDLLAPTVTRQLLTTT